MVLSMAVFLAAAVMYVKYGGMFVLLIILMVLSGTLLCVLRPFFCRYTVDENGVFLQNRWCKKQNRTLLWGEIRRLTDVQGMSPLIGRRMDFYVLSASAELEGFEEAAFYLRMPQTVCIPKNEETTVCIGHYKETRLLTRAPFRSASQEAICRCSGAVYPAALRVSADIGLWFLGFFAAAALAAGLLVRWWLFMLMILLILGILVPVCVWEKRKFGARYFMDESGVYLSNAHLKRDNFQIKWKNVMQIQEKELIFNYGRGGQPRCTAVCYLIADKSFSADWERIFPYLRRGIICVPKGAETERCMERYSRRGMWKR